MMGHCRHHRPGTTMDQMRSDLCAQPVRRRTWTRQAGHRNSRSCAKALLLPWVAAKGRIRIEGTRRPELCTLDPLRKDRDDVPSVLPGHILSALPSSETRHRKLRASPSLSRQRPLPELSE